MGSPTRTLGALLALLGAGCFPYREVYRPAYGGVVQDPDGKPVPGARVISCSASKWTGLGSGCPRRGERVSDGAGRFAFGAVRQWEWCCLGEAPQPFTVVVGWAP